MLKETITRPAFEKIEPGFGSSFRLRHFNEVRPNSKPVWHFHPEIEIDYIVDGSGKRHIGNHISYFQDGDLILLGSNLPHMGFSDRLSGINEEIVVQLKKDFLGDQFLNIPEFQAIEQLFTKAQNGLSFYGETRRLAGEKMLAMVDLSPFDRLIELLNVLRILSESDEYTILNANKIAIEIGKQDNDRINLIFQHVQEHFRSPITLEAIAKEANMTVPAFCRYFKKLTSKTFTQYVNEIRVVQACKLLAEEHLSISEICFESGFNNFSHFNKHFKMVTGKSPSEYRKTLKQVLD